MTSQPLSVSSHILHSQHHTHSSYVITLAICVASFALYKTSHPHILTSNHHFEDITPTILDIVSTVSVSSLQHYRWYHSHYMYDNTSSIYETFCKLYLWHHTHHVWQHNTVSWLHHTRHMYDIIALQKLSHPLYHTKPQSSWLHIHFRHDIINPVSDNAPTVSLSSQPLHWYHTHFVSHHTHYICDIIHSIYNIISTVYVIKLLYLWQHKLDIWNHIQYAIQNIHYPCDITVTSLCHHMHCIESITPKLCMTSLLA